MTSKDSTTEFPYHDPFEVVGLDEDQRQALIDLAFFADRFRRAGDEAVRAKAHAERLLAEAEHQEDEVTALTERLRGMGVADEYVTSARLHGYHDEHQAVIDGINHDGWDHEELANLDRRVLKSDREVPWTDQQVVDLMSRRRNQLFSYAYVSWCASLGLCPDHERPVGDGCIDDPECDFAVRTGDGRVRVGRGDTDHYGYPEAAGA